MHCGQRVLLLPLMNVLTFFLSLLNIKFPFQRASQNSPEFVHRGSPDTGSIPVIFQFHADRGKKYIIYPPNRIPLSVKRKKPSIKKSPLPPPQI